MTGQVIVGAYLDNGHVNNRREHPLLQYSLVSSGLGKIQQKK